MVNIRINKKNMYLEQIAIYLTWPVFILISWIIIKSALFFYEKKFSGEGQKDNIPSGGGKDK